MSYGSGEEKFNCVVNLSELKVSLTVSYDPIRGCVTGYGNYKDFGKCKSFLDVQRPQINSK